jgi:hypothetical protein
MHDIVNRYKPDVIFLFETHTSFTSSKSFWAREGYDKIEIQEARGQSGGIWVIQRRGNDYNFSLVRMMHQCVSFSISKGMENGYVLRFMRVQVTQLERCCGITLTS